MLSYVKIAAMLTLCIFIPPLGWLFMYKYSPFDKRTNVILAAACFAFFVNAIATSPDLKNIVAPVVGGEKPFEQGISPETFREKYNTAAKRLAPNLNLTIDETLTVDGKNFTHEFTPNLKLVGTLDGDNISALKIFTEPKNQDESFQVINVLGLLIATLNPELDAEDRGEVMRDLRMLKEVSTEGTYDWTTTRGRVTYSVHADKGKSTFTAALK